MPKVPAYDTFQQQANALPGVRQTSSASPALMGGFAADQQQRLGATVFKAAADAQHEADQVRINDAMNKAVEAKLKLTYDPQGGFIHQRGESALNRPDGKPLDEEYSARLNEHLAEIEAGLGNDAQKQAFRQQTGQMMVQFKGGIQQHVAKEFTEYNISVQDGTIKTAQQQMGLAWEDPDALAQSRDAIKAATYEAGRLRGWSAQQVEAATVEQLSRGHVAVLASAVDGGKLDYAREYLKQHTAELSPDARLSAQKALEAGDFEARTQSAADKLYADHKGDISTALGEVRTKYSGKEEDAIITRLKGLDAERVALRERAQKDAGDQAWRTYAQTGSLGKIPPSIIAAMDGKDVEALRRLARAEADAAQARREAKTDPVVYYGLRQMAAEEPENFAKVNLLASRDMLSKSDWRHLVEIQGGISKKDAAAINQQKNFGMALKAIDADMKAAGIDTTPKEGSDKATELAQFKTSLLQALDQEQHTKGRALTFDEARKVGLDQLKQGWLQGSGVFFDDKVRRYQTPPDNKHPFVGTRYGNIPADYIAQIEKSIRAKGRNPTREEVERTYQRAKDQGVVD